MHGHINNLLNKYPQRIDFSSFAFPSVRMDIMLMWKRSCIFSPWREINSSHFPCDPQSHQLSRYSTSTSYNNKTTNDTTPHASIPIVFILSLIFIASGRGKAYFPFVRDRDSFPQFSLAYRVATGSFSSVIRQRFRTASVSAPARQHPQSIF